jgi:hypothetical protein
MNMKYINILYYWFFDSFTWRTSLNTKYGTTKLFTWKQLTFSENALKLTYGNAEFHKFSGGNTSGPPYNKGRDGKGVRGFWGKLGEGDREGVRQQNLAADPCRSPRYATVEKPYFQAKCHLIKALLRYRGQDASSMWSRRKESLYIRTRPTVGLEKA